MRPIPGQEKVLSNSTEPPTRPARTLAHERNDGDQSVAEDVARQDDALAQPLGTGGPHEILAAAPSSTSDRM